MQLLLKLRSFWSLKWIVILAAVLRLSFLGSVPLSLNWDEVSMGYTAYSLGLTGRDEWGEPLPIFFRSYGEWKSAVYIYLLVPLIKIFGMSAWVVRLPSALMGILAVYILARLGAKLFNSPQAGLAAGFFLAISPWHLVLSRPAYEANVSLTLILLGIYFFLQSKSASAWLLTLSAVFFGLAPHTYNSAKVVTPFLVLFLIWQAKLYRRPRLLILHLGILTLFALPILTNFGTGKAQYRYTQVGVTTDQTALTSFYANRQVLPPLVGKLVFNQYTFSLYKVLDNWTSYFNPSFLFIEAGDHRQHHVPYRGVLYFSVGICVILGISRLRQLGLPLILIGLGFLPAALTRDTEHVLRSILAIPGFILLAGYGWATWSPKRRWLRPALQILLAFETITFLVMYFGLYPRQTARDWQYGHQQVAAYLSAHAADYDEIVMTKWFGEPQLFLAFYNRWDPVWYQSENQKLLHYEGEGRLWLDQLPEYRFGKYTFRYLNWSLETRSPRTLYIGKWDDFYQDSDYQQTILYPDQVPAFHLVKGDK